MIQMSKKHYKSLIYWANVGYGAKGKEYTKQYPKRKDPWYRINQGALNVTLGEELSAYIDKLQKETLKVIKSTRIEDMTQEAKRVNAISNDLINILLKGYKLVDEPNG